MVVLRLEKADLRLKRTYLRPEADLGADKADLGPERLQNDVMHFEFGSIKTSF